MVDMDLIILGVLQGMPMHGYQLRQQIEASFGKRFFNMSNSALYPKLAKLEADGYIQSRREQQEKVPDRKVYEITAAGRQRVHELVVAPIGAAGGLRRLQGSRGLFRPPDTGGTAESDRAVPGTSRERAERGAGEAERSSASTWASTRSWCWTVASRNSVPRSAS